MLIFPVNAFEKDKYLSQNHNLSFLSMTGIKSTKAAEHQLYVTLEEEVVEIFDASHSLPLKFTEGNGNIAVRTKWEQGVMMAVSEINFVPYHPDQFKSFLEHHTQTFPVVNPMVKNVISLENDETGKREGIKSFLKFPFPLADRIMIHWSYVKLNRKSNEHMLLFSEKGNDHLVSKYLTSSEKDKYVLGRTFLCAYWIKPVYSMNSPETIIGSNIKYLFSGDTGGRIPKWVQNTAGPKSAYDSISGLVKYIQNQSTKIVSK